MISLLGREHWVGTDSLTEILRITPGGLGSVVHSCLRYEISYVIKFNVN